MTEASKTAEPVPYTVRCRVSAPWEGRNCIIINEGGDMLIGYSLWSKAEADRLIAEIQLAAAMAFGETNDA